MSSAINHFGEIVAWDYDTANIHDGIAFQDLVDDLAQDMVVFSDTHFVKDGWEPSNLCPCQRGVWNDRMIVETV